MTDRRSTLLQIAVSDPAWRAFRRNLKGMSTAQKLVLLHGYWATNPHFHIIKLAGAARVVNHNCSVCLRVDNYVKALNRAGLLPKGTSLVSLMEAGWVVEGIVDDQAVQDPTGS